MLFIFFLITALLATNPQEAKDQNTPNPTAATDLKNQPDAKNPPNPKDPKDQNIPTDAKDLNDLKKPKHHKRGDPITKKPTYKPEEIETKYRESVNTKEHKVMDMLLLDDQKGNEYLFHDTPRIRWTQRATGHSSIIAEPIITDYNHDGRKELIFPTKTHYVEAIDINTGTKIPGFPTIIEDSGFVSKGIEYQISNEEQYTIVTSSNGFVYYINKRGEYNESRTLKIPPIYIPANWNDGLNTEGKCYIQKLNEQVIEPSFGEFLFYDKKGTEIRWKNMKERHSSHHKDHQYVPDEYKHDPFFQNELTKEGQKSLAELFHNAHCNLDDLDDHINCRHAAIYDNYAGKDGDFKYARLRAHVLSDAQMLDTEKGKRLIIPVTYFINPIPERDKAGQPTERLLDDTKYCVSAVIIFDPKDGKIVSLTTIDLTTFSAKESASLLSGFTAFGKQGYQDRIIIANAAGRIHQLSVLTGKIIDPEGWPIQVGPLMNKIVVEDVNRDGELDIVTADVNGNVVCFNMKGKVQWEMNAGGPIIHSIEVMRLTLFRKVTLLFFATTNGKIYCLDGAMGKPVDAFPISLGNSDIVGPLGVFRDGNEITITVSSSNGKFTLMDFKLITNEIKTQFNLMKNRNIFKMFGGYDSKILNAQEKSELILFTGSHSMDVDDVVYSKPVVVYRNIENNVNSDLYKTSKIYKKNGWTKMSWEKRVQEVQKQKEKQKKYKLVEQSELQLENTKSFIFGTKNGMIFCIDKRRHSTAYAETQNVRGVYIRNVEVKKKMAFVLIDYEETGEQMERLVMEQSNGNKYDIRGPDLHRMIVSEAKQESHAVTTYSVMVELPSKPQTITLYINAYNKEGLKTSTNVSFSVHSDFYKNIPTIIILPFLIFCVSVLYLLSDYWKLNVSKETFQQQNL